MLNKRANILFEEGFWKKLTRLAQVKKTSAGQLIREAVEEKYTQETQMETRKEVLERIEKTRPHFKGKVDYKALINYGRKY